MSEESRENGIGTLVGGLERDVIHLQKAFEEDRRDRKEWQDTVERQIESLGRSIQNQFHDIANQMIDKQKTPWATLASWAAVVLILGGMAATPVYRDVTRMESNIKRLNERDEQSIYDRALYQERLSSLTVSMNKFDDGLDNKLQEKMVHLDNTLKKEFETQLSMIVGDLKVIENNCESNVKLFSEKLELIKSMFEYHLEDNHPTKMIERIHQIENELHKSTEGRFTAKDGADLKERISSIESLIKRAQSGQ